MSVFLEKLSRNAPLLGFRLFSYLYIMFNKCSTIVSCKTISVYLIKVITMYFTQLWLVDWGFTSHQQLRSYGDGPWFIVQSDGLEKPGIEPATPGLQGE